jgi:hypothetical protein
MPVGVGDFSLTYYRIIPRTSLTNPELMLLSFLENLHGSCSYRTLEFFFLWVTGEWIPVSVCCLEFYLSRSVADPCAEDDCCRADGLVPESGTGDAN